MPFDNVFEPAAATVVARRIRTLRRLCWMLDGAFRLPGTKFRFGLNSLIGLTPAAGDAVLTAVSLWIVYEAHRLGVPREKLIRMAGNVAIEAVGGLVPVVGDLFDMTFKANLRNFAIIEEHFSHRF